MKYRITILTYVLSLLILFSGYAQEKENKKEKQDRHTFTMINQVGATTVKNQAETGTCWDFATQ